MLTKITLFIYRPYLPLPSSLRRQLQPGLTERELCVAFTAANPEQGSEKALRTRFLNG